MKKTLVLLAVASAFAGSAVAADRQFDAFMGRVVGNQTTVTFGGGGQPMITSSSHLGTPNTVGNMATYAGASGAGIEGRSNMPVAGTGKTVPVDVKAPISKANFGKALMFAGKIAWPIGVALQAGDIYDFLTDNGLKNVKNSGAGITAQVPELGATLSDGYRYDYRNNYYYSPSAACNSYIAYVGPGNPNNSYSVSDIIIGASSIRCVISASSAGGTWTDNVDMGKSSSGCSSGNYVVNGSCTPNPPMRTLAEQEIIDKIAQESGWPTSSARALAEALRVPGVAPAVVTETPNIVGPFAVPGEKTTTAEPVKLIPGTTTVAPPGTAVTDSGTRTISSQSTNNITYNQNTATTSTSTTSTTNITNNVTNQTINEGDTITETEEKPDIEFCGLPGTPPCKIDETGTPEAKQDTSEADAKKAYKPLEDFVANPTSALPTFPTINWAFTLPSGCAPIALPAFEPWLQEIDVCAFQPMFHDLMSFVWVLGGIFGAIGTFWRNTFSQG